MLGEKPDAHRFGERRLDEWARECFLDIHKEVRALEDGKRILETGLPGNSRVMQFWTGDG